MKPVLISCSLLLLSLALIHQTNSQCVETLQCFHQGIFNTRTCSCECFPSFTGKQCEIPRCNIQSKDCDTIPLDLCNDLLVFEYCPARCKATFCNTTTTQSILTTITATKPTTIILTTYSTNPVTQFQSTPDTTAVSSPAPPTACANVNCLNSGTFDIATCKCNCLPAYSGSVCEYLNCGQQPSDCSRFFPALCTSDYIRNYCPVVCSLCTNASTVASSSPAITESTLISTTTTSVVLPPTACTNLNCLNGGTFDITNCKCTCAPAYNGSTCEILNCDQQPSDCSRFFPALCTSDSIRYYCPVVCGLCNGRSVSVGSEKALFTNDGTSIKTGITLMISLQLFFIFI